jgi:hypothetical protein
MKPEQVTQTMRKLMSPEDRAMLEGHLSQISAPEPNPAKIPRPEREEQRLFAGWLHINELPRCWHRTDRRTGCDLGVWDFWTAANGRQAWFEFKTDISMRLRPEQEEFRRKLVKEKVEWHVVTTANEAIEIVRGWMNTNER